MIKGPENTAPGVYRADAVGFEGAMNMLLPENEEGCTLADTGAAGRVGRVKYAVASLGSGPGNPERAFVDRHHDDHAGDFEDLLGWVSGAEVGATAHEKGVIPSPRGLDNPGNAFFRGLGGILSGVTRCRRPFGSTKHVGRRICEEA